MAQMDDDTKIRALMVYCRHWGKEQARARRAFQGIQETNAIIRRDFDLRDSDMSRTGFWACLASSLLGGNMDHYFPHEDAGHLETVFARARFAAGIGISFFSPHVINASEDKMRRINAIVALPPMA